ncbi:putative Chaperonin complex component [Daphnia magna]|uniref:Putative Chaperonin complex component n=1 Tax=Daphnia magna TaxID=35525 RepID=A0A164G9S7_9CRUS|nr:putative Chaperonin complex component [Daphnia magna]
MDKVGKEGVITVEDGKSLNNELDVVKACSSTAATCRPTSSTTPKSKPRCWTTPSCCCSTRRSATSAICCPHWKPLPKLAVLC